MESLLEAIYHSKFMQARWRIGDPSRFSERSEILKIDRGYNKDGRPQCNQVVVGQIVNEDGIVLASEVMDGQTSDTPSGDESMFSHLMQRLAADGKLWVVWPKMADSAPTSPSKMQFALGTTVGW